MVTTLPYIPLSVAALNSQVYCLILKPAGNISLDYQAGQYIKLILPDKTFEPLAFSIANAPAIDHHLELHIRYYPEHIGLKSLLDYLQTHQQVFINGPFGHCMYAEISHPLLLLAGGTGFAPCKALIESFLIKDLQQPVYLYWGAQTRADLYLHKLALSWAKKAAQFHYLPILSAPLKEDNWDGYIGFIPPLVIAKHPHLQNFQVYASGPPEMIRLAKEALLAHGLPKQLFCSDFLTEE